MRAVIVFVLSTSVVGAAVALYHWGGAGGDRAGGWQAGLTPAECWFDAPLDDLTLQYSADCAYLNTAADSGKFTLPVVVFRDHSAERRADPLVYLSGGPGNSSFLEPHNIDTWYYWLEDADLGRDLIVMDQRGTGLSFPQFKCHDYSRFLRSAWKQDRALALEYDRGLATVEDCIERMRQQGFQLHQFSTSRSADDMQLLMQELNYSHWNVMGVSYGSRLALDWLRRHGGGIRALILDSVYPLDKGALTEWPGLVYDALDRFWRACRGGVICEEGDGDVEEKFWQAMAKLKAEPVRMTLPLWSGDWPVDILIDDSRFINLVYHALNDETLYPIIVAAVHEIPAGKDDALRKLAASDVNSELATEFNIATYLAVNCGEIPRVSRDAFERARAGYPELKPYTELAWEYDYCLSIPTRDDLDGFRQAVTSDVPALLVAGEFDPVTPAKWTQAAAETLPNSQYFLLPGLGHGVVGRSLCVHEALRAFLDAPAEPLTLDCN